MSIHRYTVFALETGAYIQWAKQFEKATGAKMFTDQYWTDFRVESWGGEYMPAIAKQEKIMYLYHVQKIGMTKVAKLLGASPNYVMKVIKENRQPRIFKDNPITDFKIQEWQKIRAFIPDEIFIKNL